MSDSKEVVKDPAAAAAPAEKVVTPPADNKSKQAADEAAAAAAAAKVDPKAVEAKETPAQLPVVPEKYDLKLPEGSSLDAGFVEKTAAFAKERGFSQEQAQALLDRDNSIVKDVYDSQKNNLAQKSVEWAAAVKADKELGGEKVNENVEIAKRVIDKYGSEDLKKELNLTGFGNHPEVIRIFSKLGKAMQEDKMVHGSTSAPVKSAAELIYGKKANQETTKS